MDVYTAWDNYRRAELQRLDELKKGEPPDWFIKEHQEGSEQDGGEDAPQTD